MRRASAAGRLPGVAPPGVEEGNVLTTPVYAPKLGSNIRGGYMKNKMQKVQEGRVRH